MNNDVDILYFDDHAEFSLNAAPVLFIQSNEFRTLYNLFDAHAKLVRFRFAITGFSVIHVDDSLLKVTVYLQIDNFLQIWIFGSKYWSKCDL